MNMTDSAAQFDSEVDDGILRLIARGDWRARFLGPIDSRLRDFADDSVGRALIIDMSGVERLDTTGAMMLQRTYYITPATPAPAPHALSAPIRPTARFCIRCAII